MTTAAKPATKERPIIFSGNSVRAIYAGTKTQTRRIITPQPRDDWAPVVGLYHPTKIDRNGEEYPGREVFGASDEEEGRVCRYGGAGGHLWIQENWRTAKSLDHLNANQIAAKCMEMGSEKPWAPIEYQADGKILDWDSSWGEFGRLRIARFMPRWLSRAVIEKESVTVERLHDITEADAIAEGMLFHDGRGIGHTGWRHDLNHGYVYKDAKTAFAVAWDHINGKRAPWASNPWVWRIEFMRVEG